MSDNWLVKFASRQPTADVQFRQQINAMSLDELQDFVGPSPTASIDSFMDKAASAIQQGRQLAHEYGNDLIEKTAQEVAIDQSLVNAVSDLSDDQAIKLAEMLENGTDVEKVAGLMGMAGGALKSLGGMAFKHPHMAAAAGGAALGAAAGGPGNRLGGAVAGGALGGLASKALPGVANRVQQGGFGAALKGQQLLNKAAQQEIGTLYKTAMALKCGPGPEHGEFSWLSQFEGSPLLQQAIQLAEHEVQVEIESIQKRQARQAAFKEDSFEEEWTKRDIIRAQKHLLELQLIAQRNGLGAPPQEEAQAAPPQPQSNPATQPQQSAQGVGGPGGTQLPMGQEKQAMNAEWMGRAIESGVSKASPSRINRFLKNMSDGAVKAVRLGEESQGMGLNTPLNRPTPGEFLSARSEALYHARKGNELRVLDPATMPKAEHQAIMQDVKANNEITKDQLIDSLQGVRSEANRNRHIAQIGIPAAAAAGGLGGAVIAPGEKHKKASLPFTYRR